MAAAGSAVGLGNIWGFPTQAASNGGAAFLLVYLVLAFSLAYPALMAELIIGRHAKSNIVTALSTLSTNSRISVFGKATGFLGLATVCVILSFYAIVAGWMLAFCLSYFLQLLGFSTTAQWLTNFGVLRNIVFLFIFMAMTVLVICGGVKNGIERWSARFMPALFVILLVLIAYVMTLEGALTGLKAYFIPDFNAAFKPALILSALGQSFFSMSLGVGTMLIYGSYVKRSENIVALGRFVTLIDIGVAVTAGMLIIPAMYVAQLNDIAIFDDGGELLSEDTLIFSVLPALFNTMEVSGTLVAFVFFTLMSIAALTSSISMLEAPVAYAVERHNIKRINATLLIGASVLALSTLIVFNFSSLFSLAVMVSTQYSQPLVGLVLCVFAGWVWQRNSMLKEIQAGFDGAELSLFWKIWPHYVRYVCPAAIGAIFLNQFL